MPFRFELIQTNRRGYQKVDIVLKAVDLFRIAKRQTETTFFILPNDKVYHTVAKVANTIKQYYRPAVCHYKLKLLFLL